MDSHPMSAYILRKAEAGLRRRHIGGSVFPYLKRLAAALASLMLAGVAVAHHSYARYDQNRKITLVGTVTEWKWTNPHSELSLLVSDQEGKAVAPEVWQLESESPEVLRRDFQVKRDAVKPGEKVTVIVMPLRDGSKGGHLIRVTHPDGSSQLTSNR